MIDYEKVNAAADAWHKKVKALIRQSIKSKTSHRVQESSPRPLAQRVGGKTFKKFGAIERMNVTFPRHLVFREKMVGKNRPAGTNAPDPIVNPIIAANMEELATTVTDNLANAVMRNIFID